MIGNLGGGAPKTSANNVPGRPTATVTKAVVSLGRPVALRRRAVPVGHELPPLQRRLVVVRVLRLPAGQLDLFALYLLVGDHAQQVPDAVKAGALLVVAAQDVPWRVSCVRGLQHRVSGAGVGVPAAAGGQVHWTELPLAQRVGHARLEPPLLLRVTDLQPVLYQDDPAAHDVLFRDRAELEEPVA